ncbi:unnamed protein product [Rhizopus stolonifer]
MLPIQPDAFKNEKEYDLYSTLVEHYENRVDLVLSTETENFLIDLIHMPRPNLNKAIQIQGKAMGIYTMNYPQIIKMPSIIGKHIHIMNSEIYASVQPLIEQYWRTGLISLNGILVQELIEKMDDYDLLEKIKQDTLNFGGTFLGWKYWIWQWMSNRSLISKNNSPLPADFLKEYLLEMKAGLLLDFHLEFNDFYNKIQNDVLEEWSG